MIKKISAIVAIAFLANCHHVNSNSGPGILFTETTDPVFIDNNVSPRKTGRACSKGFLNLVSTGDSSIAEAKADGRIKKVATVDIEYSNYLVYGTACTFVTGE